MAREKITGDSLFGNFKKRESLTTEAQEEIDIEAHKETDWEPPSAPAEQISSAPKYSQLDKVTVLLTTEQKEALDRITKKLMKYRSKQLKGKANKERITSNMLIRALIDNFIERENLVEPATLTNEEDVKKWVEKAFRGH